MPNTDTTDTVNTKTHRLIVHIENNMYRKNITNVQQYKIYIFIKHRYLGENNTPYLADSWFIGSSYISVKFFYQSNKCN